MKAINIFIDRVVMSNTNMTKNQLIQDQKLILDMNLSCEQKEKIIKERKKRCQ